MPITHDLAAGIGLPPRRNVVPFPAPPSDRCQLMAKVADIVSSHLCEQREVLAAAAELLHLDDQQFADRLGRMGDEEGSRLVEELVDALDKAAADFGRGSEVLHVIRARLAAGLAALGGARG